MVLWLLYKHTMHLIKIKSYTTLKRGTRRAKERRLARGFEISWIDRHCGMAREREIDSPRHRDLDSWTRPLSTIRSGGWMALSPVAMRCPWLSFGYSTALLPRRGLNCHCKMAGNVVGVYVNGRIRFLNKLLDGILNAFQCKFAPSCQLLHAFRDVLGLRGLNIGM